MSKIIVEMSVWCQVKTFDLADYFLDWLVCSLWNIITPWQMYLNVLCRLTKLLKPQNYSINNQEILSFPYLEPKGMGPFLLEKFLNWFIEHKYSLLFSIDLKIIAALKVSNLTAYALNSLLGIVKWRCLYNKRESWNIPSMLSSSLQEMRKPIPCYRYVSFDIRATVICGSALTDKLK